MNRKLFLSYDRLLEFGKNTIIDEGTQIIKVKGINEQGVNYGMSIMLIYIVATAVVNLAQFCAGEYMGRYSKIIGAAMAFVYGLILMISLKEALCIPAFEVPLSGMVSKINLAYLIIPIIQIIGIIRRRYSAITRKR